MDDNWERFINSKYGFFEVVVEKGMVRDDWHEYTLKIKGTDIVFDHRWINVQKKRDRSIARTTGGKKSYLKVYLGWLDGKDISVGLFGFMMKISLFVSWNTCILADSRTKRPLTIEQLANKMKISNKTIIKYLSEASSMKLIEKTEEGYKVNPDFIVKGVTK